MNNKKINVGNFEWRDVSECSSTALSFVNSELEDENRNYLVYGFVYGSAYGSDSNEARIEGTTLNGEIKMPNAASASTEEMMQWVEREIGAIAEKYNEEIA